MKVYRIGNIMGLLMLLVSVVLYCVAWYFLFSGQSIPKTTPEAKFFVGLFNLLIAVFLSVFILGMRIGITAHSFVAYLFWRKLYEIEKETIVKVEKDTWAYFIPLVIVQFLRENKMRTIVFLQMHKNQEFIDGLTDRP